MAILLPKCDTASFAQYYDKASQLLKPSALKVWVNLWIESPQNDAIKMLEWFSDQGITEKFSVSASTARRIIKDLATNNFITREEMKGMRNLYSFIPGGKNE